MSFYDHPFFKNKFFSNKTFKGTAEGKHFAVKPKPKRKKRTPKKDT